ncbi:hypothetical protein ANCCAN_10628 [Ancylostoma caninum]|uniref:Uncharacterized protein n=1 Tax=Ancylostoma caninum TaxID=29170 RepID=A0A368GG44_ANCCA|nr:hypothetical protein ANCCAN_10628 [Ancylostoma caninum]
MTTLDGVRERIQLHGLGEDDEIEVSSLIDSIATGLHILKVTLAQRGLSETLNGAENLTEALVSRAIDELNLQWQQKVSPLHESSDAEQDSSRTEARLFTYVDGDELPPHLRLPTVPQRAEETPQKTGYDKWITHNAVVDLPLRRNLRAIRCDKKVMYIMAYLGSLAGPYNNRDEYVVCRITLLNDRSMIFEPRLIHNGYRIHSKMGEYWAMVHVWDDYFTPLYDQLESVALVPPIPETQCFELPDEEMTQFVTLMNIGQCHPDYASNFDYRTIWVEYVAHFPDGTTCTSNNTEGQTSQCSMDENGQFHFSIPIEFDFVAAKISSFHLRFRVRSEDFWGRQYVAGYACLTPLLLPGR